MSLLNDCTKIFDLKTYFEIKD